MTQFLNALKTKNTHTENGALAHSTTGDCILDYFGQCSAFRSRSESDVFADISRIYNKDPLTALKVIFYNRLITRKVNINQNLTESVQKGQGNKDEFIKSLKWLENNHPEVLRKNISLIPYVGSYKDLWYDSAATGFYHYIDPQYVYEFLANQLQYNNEAALIAKYLPRIRSVSNVNKIKTEKGRERARRKNKWARGFCEFMGISERQYRRFKSDPKNNAHIWQRQMSARQWNKIDFNKIPGKALFNIVKGKVLDRHNLTSKYADWIAQQPVAKFTGYVYELFKAADTYNRKEYQKITYDKQFDQLLENARQNISPEILDKGVLCALDTSDSMTWYEVATGVQPYHICLSLGIYFSSLMQGYFHNNVISFSDYSKLTEFTGESFCGKVDQAKRIGGWGGTDFQSVIDEIVRVRRNNPEIPVDQYPKILLVCSDMQFNVGSKQNDKTNYETAMQKLEDVGLPKMQVIWWYLRPGKVDNFPSKLNDNGTTLISGFDPSVITVLLEGQERAERENREINPVENMHNCLDQEILHFLQV